MHCSSKIVVSFHVASTEFTKLKTNTFQTNLNKSSSKNTQLTDWRFLNSRGSFEPSPLLEWNQPFYFKT